MKKNLTVVIILFLCALVVTASMLMGERGLIYDAYYYWNLGESFFGGGGSFSLANYPQSIRGYFFPLILGISNKISVTVFNNEYVVYRLLSSVVLVLMVTYVLPSVFDIKIGTKRWAIGSVVVLFLFGIFWRDYLAYPVTDMFAVAGYLSAILIIKRMLSSENRTKTIIYSLICGAVSYAVYNTRTIYQIPLIILFLFFIVCMVRKRKYDLIFISTACLFCGLFLIAIPQIYINKNTYDEMTAAVITRIGSDENLFVAQLRWGMYVTRGESYVGDRALYPSASVKFINSLGQSLLGASDFDSVGSYLLLVLRHPFEFIGIYTEHFISGITMFYDKVYIPSIYPNKWVFIANGLLYIIAALGLILVKKDKLNWKYVLISIIPAVLTIPGAIETRFFMGIYLFVYMYVAMKLDYVELWKMIRKKPVQVCILVAAIVMVWCMAANTILSEMELANYYLT